MNYPHSNKGKLTHGKLKVGRGCDDDSDFFHDNHTDKISLKLIVFSTRKSVRCNFVTNSSVGLIYTVEALHNGHLGDRGEWLL